MTQKKKKAKISKSLNINFKGAREDIRKVAVSIFITGFIGLMLPTDKIPKAYGIAIMASSISLWLMAIITIKTKKKRKRK